MLIATPIVLVIALLLVFLFATPAFAIFGGMYETGGHAGGLFGAYDGIYGYTKAYSSMGSTQQKTNTFGIGKNWTRGPHSDGSGRTDLEAGWWWHGSESHAPLLYLARYRNGTCIERTNIDWFDPGSTIIVKIEAAPWMGNAMYHIWIQEVGPHKRYDLYRYCPELTKYPLDAAMWGERSSNVANSAEFWDVHEQEVGYDRDGNLIRNWFADPLVNFSGWDSDSGYKFIPKSNTEAWIRSGSG
jgi:hypothetical protein